MMIKRPQPQPNRPGQPQRQGNPYQGQTAVKTDSLDQLMDKMGGLDLATQPSLTTSRYTASRQNLRIIPMGGVEEVGENMTVLEYGDDLIVIDMGLAFPDDTMPGIDYIIPDTKWLEENKRRIRGVIVTHGHLDHIGAVPYILPNLGDPPVYTMGLTAAFIKKRL